MIGLLMRIIERAALNCVNVIVKNTRFGLTSVDMSMIIVKQLLLSHRVMD